MMTCVQWKGKIKLTRDSVTYVNLDLLLDSKTIFFSNNKHSTKNIILSVSNNLNKVSKLSFFIYI